MMGVPIECVYRPRGKAGLVITTESGRAAAVGSGHPLERSFLASRGWLELHAPAGVVELGPSDVPTWMPGDAVSPSVEELELDYMRARPALRDLVVALAAEDHAALGSALKSLGEKVPAKKIDRIALAKELLDG